MNRKLFDSVFSFFLFLLSTSIGLGTGEVILRAKNSRMDNYDIEIWKYAKNLKIKSDNPVLDYEHRINEKGTFQNINFRINERGLRGDKLRNSNGRRILFLGGSITLGWGVNEEDVVTNRLEKMFLNSGKDVEVLNGGMLNYNTNRYVTRFFEKLVDLKPTDIVINYFLRDAEDLKPTKPNYLLRNSQLALTVWTAFKRTINSRGQDSMEKYYDSIYKKNSIGFQIMERNLKKLSDYAITNNIRIYIVMIPDINNLIDYKFDYIHEMIEEIAKANDYIFIDSLPRFRGLSFESLYAMPGDPHPNSKGHRILAETAFPILLNTN
tara:strand:+ start:645 stop:1613 length:969 start_codon:yes stop_codon:yes gene_type:complete